MKKYLMMTLLITSFFVGKSQNLLTNGGFETNKWCDYTWSWNLSKIWDITPPAFIEMTTDEWRTTLDGSSDLISLSTCAGDRDKITDLVYNVFPHAVARTGSASGHIGLQGTNKSRNGDIYSEYITSSSSGSVAFQGGKSYYIEFFVWKQNSSVNYPVEVVVTNSLQSSSYVQGLVPNVTLTTWEERDENNGKWHKSFGYYRAPSTGNYYLTLGVFGYSINANTNQEFYFDDIYIAVDPTDSGGGGGGGGGGGCRDVRYVQKKTYSGVQENILAIERIEIGTYVDQESPFGDVNFINSTMDIIAPVIYVKPNTHFDEGGVYHLKPEVGCTGNERVSVYNEEETGDSEMENDEFESSDIALSSKELDNKLSFQTFVQRGDIVVIIEDQENNGITNVLDISGKNVFSGKGNQHRIVGLTPGVFVVSYQSSKGIVVEKLIVSSF
jgi:hypothetical protein